MIPNFDQMFPGLNCQKMLSSFPGEAGQSSQVLVGEVNHAVQFSWPGFKVGSAKMVIVDI